MAYSRFSFPLIAIFLTVIAIYISYLITVKNLFHLSILKHDSATLDPSLSGEYNPPQSSVYFDSPPNATPTWPTLSKPTSSAAQEAESVKRGLDNDATTYIPQTIDEPVEASEKLTYVTVQDQFAFKARQHQIKVLWEKYSASVPHLYSRPLSSTTRERLALIGQISVTLDLMYQDDRAEWVDQVEDVRGKLIAMAIDGERESARALSFQYVNQPLKKPVEALSWAMIANAIAPNDYYHYICEDFSVCSESVFAQAGEQAKHYAHIYNFVKK